MLKDFNRIVGIPSPATHFYLITNSITLEFARNAQFQVLPQTSELELALHKDPPSDF